MKTAKDILAGREPYFVTVGTTVHEAIRFMAEKNIGAVAVVNHAAERRLRGIFSERDLLKRVTLAGLDTRQTIIDEVMTKNVAVCGTGDSSQRCQQTMKQIKSRHLPVVDGDRLVGMISLRDILEMDIQEKEEELRMMNAYIHDMPV
jgi:CBS domain-containing protein